MGDGVCHSHHGGHSVERQHMQTTLHEHGRDWCERLAERIYEISVDSFSLSVMPSPTEPWWTASSTPRRVSSAAAKYIACSFRSSCREPSRKRKKMTCATRPSKPLWRQRSSPCWRNDDRSFSIALPNTFWNRQKGISKQPAGPQKTRLKMWSVLW